MAISFASAVRKLWAGIIDATFLSVQARGALKQLAVEINPTENKGEIAVNDGSEIVALATGTDGYVLTADSTQDSGLKWAPGGSGGGYPPQLGHMGW